MGEEKVRCWRDALADAANLAGMELLSTNGYEGQFVREIVSEITSKLCTTRLHVATNEVGIDSRVEAISHHLQVKGLEDVRIVGILGTVGAGKTTVAKAIFNRFGHRFDSKSFLHSVRENDMVKLQNQPLKDVLTPAIKKVRSIDEGTKEIEEKLGSVEQLHMLAIKHGSFDPGSRIIITTTNKQFLKTLGVDETCLAQLMNEKEALELFSWHAFRKNTPDEGYLELSREVVDYCRGLPLALQVLGSYLCKTEVFTTKVASKWRCASDKYKRVPHGDIQKKLKVSYDGLNGYHAKAIFLDISCFFIGMEKDYVMAVLDGCNLYPEIGIGELLDRCLLTVDKEGNLMMHDLIRDMGREIVCAESPMMPEEHSRLWHPEDIKKILKQKSVSTCPDQIY